MRRPKLWRWFCYTLIIAALTLILLPAAAVQAAEEGTFTGSWIASGQRHVLDFMPDREVFTFRLQGHVNLTNNMGEVADFWSECTGIWDDVTGSEGRCVWRSKKGEKVFVILRGRALEEGIQVTAEVVGGTGSLRDVEGIANFTWTSVFMDPDSGSLTAHTKNMEGSYRIP
ncbi:MAG: hypothetical protein QNI97_07655 [Desulfobacterales bacterium]|nr:hypothetical protein [Desulfobacterales bacterium]MDJ0856610.1 hypothetical protein [Desulfobacterales bacterium]MDJ0989596.1 hypothetical protein [Desulfobacterales bacterium]